MEQSEAVEEYEAVREYIRLIKLRLASEGASYAVAHEIIIVEVMARILGVYEEVEEELEELKRLYAAIHAGELLRGRRLYEQRFQRVRSRAWRAARLGRHWA